MIKNLELSLIVLLLIMAGLFRLHTAAIVPILPDEQELIDFIKNISWDWNNLQLPVGDHDLQNPILAAYTIKLGTVLFGENRIGIRILFVVLGTVSLFFIFKLTEENLDIKTAFLALYLLAFSQYHIAVTRFAFENTLLFFFIPPALYTFFRGLQTQKAKYAILTAILIGLGCLSYEPMALFALTLLFYVASDRRHKLWLKSRSFYFSLLIMILIVSPFFIWSCENQFSKIGSEHVFDVGFSLRSLYLYFAELLPLINEHLHVFRWDIHSESIFFIAPDDKFIYLSALSSEAPVIHWPLAVLIWTGFFYHLKQKNKSELIKFSLFMFGFVFLATSVIAGAYSLFDDHWWAGMTVFPGVILCSHMLIGIFKKYPSFKFVIASWIVYFFIHSAYFVTLPKSQFAIPLKEFREDGPTGPNKS